MFKTKKGHTLSQSKGFTLIELIVVIAVIGILAGLIVMRIGNVNRDARMSKRNADLTQIRNAIEQYRAANGSLSTYATGNLVASSVNNDTTGAFRVNDSKGNRPSGYLQGSVYPQDPQSTATTPQYYQINVTTTGYTLSRNTSVSDNPTATEVPNVTD